MKRDPSTLAVLRDALLPKLLSGALRMPAEVSARAGVLTALCSALGSVKAADKAGTGR